MTAQRVCDTVRLMKVISIRELHEKTGQWVRQASRHGEILVTDNGRAVARLTPEAPQKDVPYFARRVLSPAFLKLSRSGKSARGTDSTVAIAEDREDRSV